MGIDRSQIFATKENLDGGEGDLPGALAAFGLCAVVALAPLPFGSMDTRIVGGWTLLLSATLLLCIIRKMVARNLVFLASFAVVASCWLFIVCAQLDYFAFVPRRLQAPIWAQAAAILGTEELNGSISIARNQPFFAAGPQIGCALSVLCGYLIARDNWAARLILICFAGSSLVYSLYGIVAFVFWPHHLLWHQKYNYLNSLTGTFVNPNVAATYFGAGTIAWFLFLAASLKKSSIGQVGNWREFLTLYASSRRTKLLLLGSLILLATTLMTGSRAGSVFSLAALAGALGTHYRRELREKRLLLAFPIMALLAILAIISVLAPRVSERFGIQGFFDAARSETYKSTLNIISEHPWLGTGLGTFRWAFPGYRSDDIPSYGIWEYAHNTTLEIAAEMGIPFTLVLVVAWLSVFTVLGRGMVARKRDAILPTAAFWIGLLAIVHSQVDFPLQIPGFALAVCPLIGMGLAQSGSRAAREFT